MTSNVLVCCQTLSTKCRDNLKQPSKYFLRKNKIMVLAHYGPPVFFLFEVFMKCLVKHNRWGGYHSSMQSFVALCIIKLLWCKGAQSDFLMHASSQNLIR